MSTVNESDIKIEPVSSPHSFFRRRLLEPLKHLLGDGLSPKTLAWSLAVGAVIGTMPLVWGTTLLCLGAALLLRLNPLPVQLGNLASWPLQIVLAYPYLRFGTAWFGTSAPTLAGRGGLLTAAGASPLLRSVAQANGVAIGAWAVTSPVLFLLLYTACRRLVAALNRRERDRQKIEVHALPCIPDFLSERGFNVEHHPSLPQQTDRFQNGTGPV